MVDPYTSLDQKPYSTHYIHVDTVIDSPVQDVWPHALDIRTWMTDHKLETIAGKAGEVGHFERVWPRDVGQDVPLPHYHLYGVAKVIPFKLIALEVFPEKGGSYGNTLWPADYMAFDNILLTDVDGKTHVTFVAIGVNDIEREDSEDRNFSDMITRYFATLTELVENERQAAKAT